MYAGQIFEIPVGIGGLVGTKNQSAIGPDKLIIARNIAYDGGNLHKEGGATKYNSSAISGAPVVMAGWDWWPTAGVQRMVVVTSAGDILKDSGAGTFGTTLASGLTVTDAVPMFVEGGKEAAANNRKLFIFTGLNAVRVLSADGATATALATPPADWTGSSQPSFGLSHEGRLWGGGNLNDPHRLYYSTVTDHENMTGATSGSLSIYPGEGERLVCALSFKGLIIAWKYPTGTYLVDTTDPAVANWKIKRLSNSVGGVSPLGAAVVDDDIVFLDGSANFHLLSAVTEFGDMTSRNLSKLADVSEFIKENFNLARLTQARAIYYSSKREAHFAVAGAGSLVNNVRFVLDLNRPDMFRFRYSDRDIAESMWLRKDTTNAVQRPMIGDNAGFVWQLDRTEKSKDGAGYSSAFQTPYMDFAWIDQKLATVRKLGQFLEIVVEPTGNWDMTVDIYWDGVLAQTIAFNMGTTGAVLGSFVLGTDSLGGNQILNRRQRIVGSGRRLSIAGHNSGAGEDFSVGKFYLHAAVGDEREREE